MHALRTVAVAPLRWPLRGVRLTLRSFARRAILSRTWAAPSSLARSDCSFTLARTLTHGHSCTPSLVLLIGRSVIVPSVTPSFRAHVLLRSHSTTQ
jgi:hypothetical protein